MNYIKSTVVTAATTLLPLILRIFSIKISFVRFPTEILKCKKKKQNQKTHNPKSLELYIGCKKEIIIKKKIAALIN